MEENTRSNKREFYWLVLITVPTLLMAVVSQYIDSFVVKTISQVLIFFFQAVIVKGIIDNQT